MTEDEMARARIYAQQASIESLIASLAKARKQAKALPCPEARNWVRVMEKVVDIARREQ